MNEQPLDLKTRYNEGCSAIRHYSNCVMNIRTVTIAQGIVLMSAATYLTRENRFRPSLLLCIFGLLFTGILHMLQKSYWEHFENAIRAVVEMEIGRKLEEKELIDPRTADAQKGIWNVYYSRRAKRFNTWWWYLLVRHGPFLLLLTSLTSLLVYDVYRKWF